jgi:hypothetical protein
LSIRIAYEILIFIFVTYHSELLTSPEWKTFELHHSNSVFPVSYSANGCILESMQVNHDNASLIIKVIGKHGAEIALEIPNYLLEAKDGACENFADLPFYIELNGVEWYAHENFRDDGILVTTPAMSPRASGKLFVKVTWSEEIRKLITVNPLPNLYKAKSGAGRSATEALQCVKIEKSFRAS